MWTMTRWRKYALTSRHLQQQGTCLLEQNTPSLNNQDECYSSSKAETNPAHRKPAMMTSLSNPECVLIFLASLFLLFLLKMCTAAPKLNPAMHYDAYILLFKHRNGRLWSASFVLIKEHICNIVQTGNIFNHICFFEIELSLLGNCLSLSI